MVAELYAARTDEPCGFADVSEDRKDEQLAGGGDAGAGEARADGLPDGDGLSADAGEDGDACQRDEAYEESVFHHVLALFFVPESAEYFLHDLSLWSRTERFKGIRCNGAFAPAELSRAVAD
jgi:hypothetical protein